MWNLSIRDLSSCSIQINKKIEIEENKTFALRKRKPLHKSFAWRLCCLGSVQAKGFGLGRFGFVGSVRAWVHGFHRLSLSILLLGFVGLLLGSPLGSLPVFGFLLFLCL